MAAIIKHILNGTEYTPPRQKRELKVLAIFDGDSIQANITISTLNFVNDAKKAIDDWLDPDGTNLATEGMPYRAVLTDGEITIIEEYYLNFEDHKELSSVECEVTAAKESGLANLDDRALDITMQLLKIEGLLTSDDWVRIPYVVENRKRLLEFVQLQMQIYNVAKSIYDETFKLVNIISDIASGLWFTTVGAAVVALVNLATTITQLVLLTIQLVKLLKDMQEIVFPMVRYHNGINIKNWVVKALARIDYGFQTSAEFEATLDRVMLLGSKNDQIGKLAAAIELGDLIGIYNPEIPGDGILSSNDPGYTLSETFELMNKMFFTKIAVVDGVVQIRPWNDPYWVQSASYNFPNVKIETGITNATGIKRRNYEEMYSRFLIEYAKDDTDLHTLTNVNSTISEYIQSPIAVSNKRHILFKGLDNPQIGYALCVRKSPTDKLFGVFQKLSNIYAELQEAINDLYDTYPGLSDTALPDFVDFVTATFIRAGACKIENHFFAVPKIVYLDPQTGRIPEDFADHIGADALFTNYHSYKSMVPGVKNPDKPLETNQKIVYEGVRIPFGIRDYQQTIVNSYFTFGSGQIGKFTRIEWDVEGDFAEVDFYVFENWCKNIKGQLVTFDENTPPPGTNPGI